MDELFHKNKPILDVMDIIAAFKNSISVYYFETLSEQVWLYKLKEVMRDIEKALKSGEYYYVLRIDVRGYYATIERKELLKLLQKNFDDPLILKYRHDIVKRLVDRDDVLCSPKKSIPLRSTLSPLFGALYLTPLDEAFSSQDAFYRKYVDDIIILVINERQHRRARKRLFEVLRELHLEVSPQKTRMGKLDVFHFLGVKYEASRNPQSSALI